MSRRNEQISSVLREAIQEFIARGLNDPRVGGLVTVTAVRVAEDLANADVMVSVLPEEKQDLAMHGLRHAASHIRRQVGDKVALRQMPRLNFKLDRSLKRDAELLAALAKAAAVTPPAPPAPTPSASPTPPSPTPTGPAKSAPNEGGEGAAGGGAGDNAPQTGGGEDAAEEKHS